MATSLPGTSRREPWKRGCCRGTSRALNSLNRRWNNSLQEPMGSMVSAEVIANRLTNGR